jgi:DNA-3-methyladenine glycosylase I
MPSDSTVSMASPKTGVITGEDGIARCWWAAGDPAYARYHDLEWGRPVANDRRLFEKLSLEGFQSGLSWLIILRKREAFRKAFDGFDIRALAAFDGRRVRRLLADPGIVRNRAKIEATVNNAGRCLELIQECGSLAAYIWSYEPPARSDPQAQATALSKDLKRRGWSFVGPTTVYAFMQAMGLVNDHLKGCDSYQEVERLRAAFRRPK